MRRCVARGSVRLIAGSVLGALLLAITAVPLAAQPTAQSHPGRGLGAAYDAAHELTFTGTVEQVVSKRVIGSPVGLHLVIAGQQGTVDAHVGPFLGKDTLAALRVGLPIQIVGAMAPVNGKQYLFARQLTFGGRTVTVRSKSGFLMPTTLRRRAASRSRIGKVVSKGGVR